VKKEKNTKATGPALKQKGKRKKNDTKEKPSVVTGTEPHKRKKKRPTMQR